MAVFCRRFPCSDSSRRCSLACRLAGCGRRGEHRNWPWRKWSPRSSAGCAGQLPGLRTVQLRQVQQPAVAFGWDPRRHRRLRWRRCQPPAVPGARAHVTKFHASGGTVHTIEVDVAGHRSFSASRTGLPCSAGRQRHRKHPPRSALISDRINGAQSHGPRPQRLHGEDPPVGPCPTAGACPDHRDAGARGSTIRPVPSAGHSVNKPGRIGRAPVPHAPGHGPGQ